MRAQYQGQALVALPGVLDESRPARIGTARRRCRERLSLRERYLDGSPLHVAPLGADEEGMRSPRAQPLPGAATEVGRHILIADEVLRGSQRVHGCERLVILLCPTPTANGKHPS